MHIIYFFKYTKTMFENSWKEFRFTTFSNLFFEFSRKKFTSPILVTNIQMIVFFVIFNDGMRF